MSTERNTPDGWHGYLPDPANWLEELARVVRRGDYIYMGHNDDWLILLSAKEGDLVGVQGGGAVQARLAVNRTTGEVIHPTPGVPIGEWQAGVMGEMERYLEDRERLRNSPLRRGDLNRMRFRRGRPKEV